MHKVRTHGGLGCACPISNIQNAMASSLLEQADALLDSAASDREASCYYDILIVQI